MTINQLIFFGSAACIGAAFLLMLLVMWHHHVSWKRKLDDEQGKRAALERRFSIIVDADAEAMKVTQGAQALAQQILSKAESEAEERERESKALVA